MPAWTLRDPLPFNGSRVAILLQVCRFRPARPQEQGQAEIEDGVSHNLLTDWLTETAHYDTRGIEAASEPVVMGHGDLNCKNLLLYSAKF